MYTVNFYSRRTRRLLAGGTQVEGFLPKGHPLNFAAINDGDLAEAVQVNHQHYPVMHFDGEKWLDGPLPGKFNRMHGD